MMAEWFWKEFGAKAPDKDKNTMLEAWQTGDEFAAEAWRRLSDLATRHREQAEINGNDYGAMEATLLMFVAARMMFRRCQRSVEHFDKKWGSAKNPARKMWELLDAAMSDDDAKTAIAAMKKVAEGWDDD